LEVDHQAALARALRNEEKALNTVCFTYFFVGSIKTSFVLPEDLYLELKRRAAEERRAVRDLIIEAILEYISKPRGGSRGKLVELITTPHQGASPEDYKEYGYEDV